mgnify:FL=1
MEHPWIKAGEKPAGKQNLLATTSRLRNSMRQFGSMVQRPPPELLDVKEEVGGWERTRERVCVCEGHVCRGEVRRSRGGAWVAW